MLNSFPIERVYLACGSTDMRKSINGLVLIVQECFHKNPFEEHFLYSATGNVIRSKFFAGSTLDSGSIINDLKRLGLSGPLLVMKELE